MNNDKKALWLFLIITFAVSMVVEAVWIHFGEAATNANISILLMFVPCVAAIITSRPYFKKQKVLGFNRCKFGYAALAVLIPFVYYAGSYALFWLFAKGSFGNNYSSLVEQAAAFQGGLSDSAAIVSALIVMIPINVIAALGEEVGWRGFMYPLMRKLWGWKMAIVASGAIWALWHLPLVLTELYYHGTALWFRVPMFVLYIFAATIIISWLRAKSNSVWPAILFHASLNYFDQIVFQSFTKHADSAYFVGETGVISVAFTIIIAAIILVKDRKAFAAN